MATAAITLTEAQDERLIREQLAELTLPAGVRFHHLELKDDWLGELTWSINFTVSNKTVLTEKFIDEFTRIQQGLRLSLLDADINYRASTHLLDGE